MTREEAIQVLQEKIDDRPLFKDEREAFDMAIEALQFVEHFDLLKEFQSLQEVVLCKDCRFWKNEHLCLVMSRYGSIDTKAEHYCSWGERQCNYFGERREK